MIGGVGIQLWEVGFGAEAKSGDHFIVVVVQEDVADWHDGFLVLVGVVGVHEVQGGGVGRGTVGAGEVYGDWEV